MSKNKKFKCPICLKLYENTILAQQCAHRFGYKQPKYKKGIRVRIITKYNYDELIGIIENWYYAKPDSFRKPHQLVYLIKLEASYGKLIGPEELTLTTATEEEIQSFTY